MLAKRIIARLDVKAPNLVKGIRLEGFRVLGKPADFAVKYDEAGIDELLYVDMVASLYGRNSLTELIEATANLTFVPLGVCGGIRTIEDVDKAFRAGADKVAINTAAVQRPALISEIARIYGSQAVVLSVEAKKTPRGWEAYTDNGREKTNLDVIEWVKIGVGQGAGEVLLTSVDRDGTKKGGDVDLVMAVSTVCDVPIVASGGVGCVRDIDDLFRAGASAVAVGTLLHSGSATVQGIKSDLAARGVTVRAA